MQALDAIAALESLFHVENIVDEFVILFAGRDFHFRSGLFDGTERFHHEHGMVRDDGAAAFVHNGRMRDLFRIAHIHDVPNDVVGVFLE